MGSHISTFEDASDILDYNTTADQNFIDMIDEISLEINLRFFKVRISEVKMD
jgi:hypothetical protein